MDRADPRRHKATRSLRRALLVASFALIFGAGGLLAVLLCGLGNRLHWETRDWVAWYAMSVGGAGAMLAALVLGWIELRRRVAVGIGVVALVVYVATTAWLAIDATNWHYWMQYPPATAHLVSLVAGLAWALAGVLLRARLRGLLLLYRYFAQAAAGVAALVLIATFTEMTPVDGELAAGATFLAILIAISVGALHYFFGAAPISDAVTTALRIQLTCPRCQLTQELSAGRAACAGCGLKLRIEIEEERCAGCGYTLYMLTSPCCPECGTPVAGMVPPPCEVPAASAAP